MFSALGYFAQGSVRSDQCKNGTQIAQQQHQTRCTDRRIPIQPPASPEDARNTRRQSRADSHRTNIQSPASCRIERFSDCELYTLKTQESGRLNKTQVQELCNCFNSFLSNLRTYVCRRITGTQVLYPDLSKERG